MNIDNLNRVINIKSPMLALGFLLDDITND
ncbi:hypothetical protein SKA34_08723 [Photobacterium sp. SKA34]|uniref:Uncharacterized protein n=1 Tax=Photobacterium angustum (strain S14 / CCUG 15956) TaxID=314292 RepID=Q1ZN57_PHOAS|nr:hypothetical protein SKA34_08723 [Photobacterium sp. SKA34]EAS63481.1 hypothetical protein VAS14_08415 [Vibrio angustum S14] [Photobacterium angustum S14]